MGEPLLPGAVGVHHPHVIGAPPLSSRVLDPPAVRRPRGALLADHGLSHGLESRAVGPDGADVHGGTATVAARERDRAGDGRGGQGRRARRCCDRGRGRRLTGRRRWRVRCRSARTTAGGEGKHCDQDQQRQRAGDGRHVILRLRGVPMARPLPSDPSTPGQVDHKAGPAPACSAAPLRSLIRGWRTPVPRQGQAFGTTIGIARAQAAQDCEGRWRDEADALLGRQDRRTPS